jgi:hypothetical protein
MDSTLEDHSPELIIISLAGILRLMVTVLIMLSVEHTLQKPPIHSMLSGQRMMQQGIQLILALLTGK